MQLEAMRGDERQFYERMRSGSVYQRLSEAIRGYQRSSEVISGHQRPSEAIRAPHLQLQGMHAESERGLPAREDLGVLPRGAVARAGHVAHDPIIP